MLKLTELVETRIINLNLNSNDKNSIFEEMGTMLKEAGYVSDLKKFIGALHKREEEFSTGLGFGFGIPHARDASVTKPAIAIGRSQPITNYEAFDDEPITMVLMIAVPDNQNSDYMEILSQISRRLMNVEFREKLKLASNSNKVIDLLNEFIK